MEFFENQSDFMDLEDEEIDIIRCEECKYEWEATPGEEPAKCPECKIEFI